MHGKIFENELEKRYIRSFPGVTGRPKEAMPPQLSSCASPDIFIRSRKQCIANAGFRY